MRKLVIFTIALVCHQMSFAQINTFPSTGNVGIGTVSPLSGGGNSAWLTLEGISSYSGGNIYSIGGVAKGYSYVDNDGLLTQQAVSGQKLVVNNSTTAVAITTSGNVGIGTLTPGSKLTVAGKIHSQEVKVDINAGADFVFDKSYDLRNLEELEKYIQKNKRLPEIAPAADMQKNGLELGEMNIRLLQKIEELTLYLIQRDKEIKTLTERMNKLEK